MRVQDEYSRSRSSSPRIICLTDGEHEPHSDRRGAYRFLVDSSSIYVTSTIKKIKLQLWESRVIREPENVPRVE